MANTAHATRCRFDEQKSLVVAETWNASRLPIGTVFSLDRSPSWVGFNDGCIPNRPNEIVLGGGTLSRNHAYFELRDRAWWVVDHGSTDGVFVNGEPCTQRRLVDGDHVRFGNTVLALDPTKCGEVRFAELPDGRVIRAQWTSAMQSQGAHFAAVRVTRAVGLTLDGRALRLSGKGRSGFAIDSDHLEKLITGSRPASRADVDGSAFTVTFSGSTYSHAGSASFTTTIRIDPAAMTAQSSLVVTNVDTDR